ncbi:hypothetical protein GIB67_041651 [Kingdonia uniflora]|uniref:F-box protein At5g52880-like ARM repeats region domain-containing protein n=1 Tax=Kingdonia uniflora TaxID=39325 RepID=A0A7J7MQW0_9MAGN|nr:hypothetical protein GIB67_041651 [Kingdonia uniflora]
MVNCYSQLSAAMSDDAPFTVMLMKITRLTFSSGNKVQTTRGMSAANLLLQAAEASLPRQKRVSAITKFKHAVVAHKKHYNTKNDEEDKSWRNEFLVASCMVHSSEDQ